MFALSGSRPGWLIWLLAALMGLAVLFGTWHSYLLWRSPERATILSDRVTNGMGHGDLERSRAHVRALPVAVTLGALLVVELLVLLSLQGEDQLDVAGPVALASMLLNNSLLVLWSLIFWLNRPRFLVPPHMRGDKGFVHVRRIRRRESESNLGDPGSMDGESDHRPWRWQDGASQDQHPW
jgi:hypothetical protein